MIHVTKHVVYDTYDDIKNDETIDQCSADEITKYVMHPDGKTEVTFDYVRECEPCRGPKALPADIKIAVAMTCLDPRPKNLIKILKNIDNFFPGFGVREYTLAQEAGSPASLIIVVCNFDDEPEEEDTDDLEESVF